MIYTVNLEKLLALRVTKVRKTAALLRKLYCFFTRGEIRMQVSGYDAGYEVRTIDNDRVK